MSSTYYLSLSLSLSLPLSLSLSLSLSRSLSLARVATAAAVNNSARGIGRKLRADIKKVAASRDVRSIDIVRAVAERNGCGRGRTVVAADETIMYGLRLYFRRLFCGLGFFFFF